MLNPMRGEVWWVDFEPVEGSEIGKERPAVVIGDETLGKLRVRVVVPITGWKEPYKEYVWMTAILPHRDTGLTKPSAADALQIRTVAVTRFTDRLGMLATAVVDEIASSVALCVKAPRT